MKNFEYSRAGSFEEASQLIKEGARPFCEGADTFWHPSIRNSYKIKITRPGEQDTHPAGFCRPPRLPAGGGASPLYVVLYHLECAPSQGAAAIFFKKFSRRTARPSGAHPSHRRDRLGV